MSSSVALCASCAEGGNTHQEDYVMSGWLRRILLWAFLILLALWLISRLTNREEDFEDYDDIDLGMDFAETPVEIDVSAEPAPAKVAAHAGKGNSATREPALSGTKGSIIDVMGIGPTYAARLHDLGIATLSDLAKADAGALAEKLEVIGGREAIEGWIKQAQEMTK
jgi:predicted flap endonuclease-1-like 5' DNA nuclease